MHMVKTPNSYSSSTIPYLWNPCGLKNISCSLWFFSRSCWVVCKVSGVTPGIIKAYRLGIAGVWGVKEAIVRKQNLRADAEEKETFIYLMRTRNICTREFHWSVWKTCIIGETSVRAWWQTKFSRLSPLVEANGAFTSTLRLFRDRK